MMLYVIGLAVAAALIAHGCRRLMLGAESPTASATASAVVTEAQEEVSGGVAAACRKAEEHFCALPELSRIWRKEAPPAAEPSAPDDALYLNRTVRRFYREDISGRPFFTGQTLSAVNELLRLLDVRGNCPSVVNVKGEPERELDAETYRKLARVNLADHSINVAREVRVLLPDGLMAAKGVVAALAHDLGKIPSSFDVSAAVDHATLSVVVLREMPHFTRLNYADEVIEAIKFHHANPVSPLGKVLKKADQETRRKELALPE